MTRPSPHVVEFIPAEDFKEEKESEVERVYPDVEPYSETAEKLRPLSQMPVVVKDGVSRVALPRDVSRRQVVQAFTDAFELVGGVPRLAHWADNNYGEFAKLYARLLPTTAQQQIEHGGSITIRHVLPKGALDE